MSKTFEQGKDEVAKLCHYFATNRLSFLAAGVKEAHIRQTLIDPFFEALGWDVRNASRNAPQYREVIPEDSLDVEGQQKAPDYTFRVGTLPKFYVEAKKCGIHIGSDPGPAYQLRRYGFSAKLAFSILTDFEELAVYDCTTRPRPGDKASRGRIFYFRFEEYGERWREIWEIFSREAVWSGQFDQYAASKRKRGTSAVDSEFLKDIEGWREELARNIARRNENLSVDDLNVAVQQTIDRIVFLRMAEDRGLESYGQLLQLCERPNIYPRFMRELCRKADEKYNSGLFHFQKETDVSEAPDTLTPGLAVDDRVLKPIIQGLYFEHGSPYNFRVMPVEILGTVYERFLGKIIRLTAGHQAKVEEKPEVRKAGGVYYTPAYIVDYIVRNTIGKQIAGKSPAALAGGKTTAPFRVLDMACGSGSFLLGAYQFLLDHCLEWYQKNFSKKYAAALYEDATGGIRLSISERKRILTTHIFGVDIDGQAVETTKLSLLLKALEGEDDNTLTQQLLLFQDRALPNLSDNIKCGNSLIASDFSMLPEDLVRVRAFDWPVQFPDAMKAGGFDCVIGNPPYIRIQTLQENDPESADYLKRHYTAAEKGNYDLYVVFVQQALNLLSVRGQFGYILPHKFFNTQYGQALRANLAKARLVNKIVHFGDQQVFDKALTYTCLLFLSKQPENQFEFVRVGDLTSWQNGNGFAKASLSSSKLDQPEWTFSASPNASLLERICAENTKLSDVADRIFQGLVTGADPVFILEKRSKFVYFSEALGSEVHLEPHLLHPLCKGSVNVRRYEIDDITKSILFPYRIADKKAQLICPDEFAKKYPKCWQYLVENRKILENRERGKWRHDKWYAFGRSQNLAAMEQEKILTPSIAKGACFTHDRDDFYYFIGSGGGGGGGYGITLKPTVQEHYRYVLALLNSRLLYAVVKSVSSVFANGYYAYNRQYIQQLPIRRIDFSDSADKARHDKLVGLADKMLALMPRLRAAQSESEKGALQNAVTTTDAEIDRLVYELYGLSEEEIKIVEGEC